MYQVISPLQDQSGTLLTIDFSSVKLSAAQFHQLCRDNRDLRLELTSTGELIVMPPAGSKTGARNFSLNAQLGAWVNKDQTGIGFDSSAGFTLPNGAKRSPDSSWVGRERWDALTQDEQEGFAPLCPDFVVELRSPTDVLAQLQEKIREYLANGAQLGWLVDPLERKVYICRPGKEVEVLDDPTIVSGDPVLPGFTLQVQELW